MADDSEHIHRINPPDLPTAQIDFDGITIQSLDAGDSPERALEECQRRGGMDVTLDQVLDLKQA